MFGDDEKNREDVEGAEPLEEARADGCQVGADRCEAAPGQLDGPPHEAQFGAREELAEAFSPEPIPMVFSPEDGLPVPANEPTSLATAPRFSIDNLVCIADEREYVEIVDVRFSSTPACGDRLVQDSGMTWLVRGPFNRKQEDRVRMRFAPDRIRKKLGMDAVELNDQELQEACARGVDLSDADRITLANSNRRIWMRVEPQRPQCVHYRRQVMANDDVPNPKDHGHFIMFRLCEARRSVGGALMSVRDEAVYACEFRVPRDVASEEKHLHAPDRARLSATVEQVPLFGHVPTLDPKEIPR